MAPAPPSKGLGNPAGLPAGQTVPAAVQVRTVYMTDDKRDKAIELAREALQDEKMSASPRDIAGHLKLKFDALHGPCWHAVVGRSYGSFVTHGTAAAGARGFIVV